MILAENGLQAVAATETNTIIDLILMDVQMPEMGGFEATAIIRGEKLPSESTLPSLVCARLPCKGIEKIVYKQEWMITFQNLFVQIN